MLDPFDILHRRYLIVNDNEEKIPNILFLLILALC